MREHAFEIPKLEARAARYQQSRSPDPAALAHRRGKLQHPVGREGRRIDKAIGPAQLMVIVKCARRFGEPLGNFELALQDVDSIERDEAGRFLVQANEQEFVDAARSRSFEEAARQHQFAARRNFAQRAANVHFLHRLIPCLSKRMVNAENRYFEIS